MAGYTIKIESLPKHAPDGAASQTQEWTVNNLTAVRKLIADQRTAHQKKSKWFNIYKNNVLIFESRLIHSAR